VTGTEFRNGTKTRTWSWVHSQEDYMNGHELKNSCIIYFQSNKVACLFQLLILMHESLKIVLNYYNFNIIY